MSHKSSIPRINLTKNDSVLYQKRLRKFQTGTISNQTPIPVEANTNSLKTIQVN